MPFEKKNDKKDNLKLLKNDKKDNLKNDKKDNLKLLYCIF